MPFLFHQRGKAEKLQELKDDQTFYRQEAIRLDQLTVAGREKIREMTAKLHSVERERDWLLKRLRKEKKKFTYFSKKLGEKMERGYYDGSDSVFTDASSLNFEVVSPLVSPATTPPLLSKRSPHALFLPPSITNSDKKGRNKNSPAKQREKMTPERIRKVDHRKGLTNGAKDHYDDENTGMLGRRKNRRHDEDVSAGLSMFSDNSSLEEGSEIKSLEDEVSLSSASLISAITTETHITQKNYGGVDNLVKHRMKIDDMEKMLHEALNQTANGMWRKFAYTDRSPQEIVTDCIILMEIGERPPDSLINELMACPELYQVILNLMNKSVSPAPNDNNEEKTVNTGLESVLSCYF